MYGVYTIHTYTYDILVGNICSGWTTHTSFTLDVYVFLFLSLLFVHSSSTLNKIARYFIYRFHFSSIPFCNGMPSHFVIYTCECECEFESVCVFARVFISYHFLSSYIIIMCHNNAQLNDAHSPINGQANRSKICLLLILLCKKKRV